MSEVRQLGREEAARYCGYANGDVISRLVNRGTFPKPDGRIGQSPWWWSTTLDKHKPNPPGPPPIAPNAKPREYRAGRTCPICDRLLSKYNPGPNCHKHTRGSVR